jgi:predicted RNA-binding protein with PUA-like domain
VVCELERKPLRRHSFPPVDSGGIDCKEYAVKKPAGPAGGWLFKEEPKHYSYSDLERDGSTLWDGVTNNLARQNLRKVRPGDRVIYYHTGLERAIIGEMRVLEGPMPDPASADPKAVAVRVEAVRRWPKPVKLQQIKDAAAFAGWDLIRLPRLSVVAVSPDQWRRLERMAGL